MLFRKKINRSCSYCQRGTAMGDEQILCAKYGVVSVFFSCRKFRYDPFKRTPPKMKAFDVKNYKETDFSL